MCSVWGTFHIDNGYISNIPDLSTRNPEDYADWGYYTGSEAARYYKCGGIEYTGYLFYVHNNNITLNYDYISDGNEAWDNWYCIGG